MSSEDATPSTDPRHAHRARLVETAERQSQSYDTAVMTLAGGALGVSFAFIKDLVGGTPDPETIPLLRCAWICLAGSLLACLLSMLSSQFALARAIKQADALIADPNARVGPAGGFFNRVTRILNVAAGVLFVAGVYYLALLATENMATKARERSANPTPVCATPSATATIPATSSPTTTGTPTIPSPSPTVIPIHKKELKKGRRPVRRPCPPCQHE